MMTRRNKYFDHGKSNPDAGPSRHRKKVGKVPRPRGNYEAGLVEHEAKDMPFGNRVVKVADMPVVFDRPHTDASSGTEQFSGSKPATHGYHGDYRGQRNRDYKIEQVRDAQELKSGHVKTVRARQLGSNQHLGN